MHIKQGCTRLVILTETLAIKIALPLRPFLPFFILAREFLNGGLKKKVKKHNGNLIRLAIRIATIGGIDANRREMRIYREHPEYPIASVLRSYVWGFVIVMPRGEPIKDLSESWGNQALLPPRLRDSDVFYSANVCRFGNELRFIDYGDPSADEVLPAFYANCRF